MEKIFTKNIELQDAKYKQHPNNNNETSIFIPKAHGDTIGLENGGEFTFYLEKENIIYTLFHTFNYINDNVVFEKLEPITLDSSKIFIILDTLRDAPNLFTNRVRVSINGNRYYLNGLRQGDGFSLRDILIGGIYNLVFYEDDQERIIARVELRAQELREDVEVYDIFTAPVPQPLLSNNIVFYGAPGTGKSFKVEQIIKGVDPLYYERVTFHPEYDHASFVGGYKPVSEKDEEGNYVIRYKFIPQAFSNIYSRAWNDLDHQYYLVIEELNRGNCAEIFGDIFQLLDRNSSYSVSPSKELREHLIAAFNDNVKHEGIKKGLRLPANLQILATMNTSDQSLFPIDSAFKRRWDWEYIPICYEEQTEDGKENASYAFQIELPDGKKYSWIDFIHKINQEHIRQNAVLGADKCIGNYFVKPDRDSIITLRPFINKVIFYLWNDVFKDEMNEVFSPDDTYEDFFPIDTAGVVKIKELFDRIGLKDIEEKGEANTFQITTEEPPVN